MSIAAIPMPVIVKSGLHVVGAFTAEIASGAITIGEVLTNISGQPVTISGQTVVVESGTHVVGDFPIVESGLHVVGDFTAEVESGLHVVGDFTTEVASGLYVVAEIASGAISIGEVTTNISGQPVTVSGNIVIVESGVHVVGDFSTTVESGLHVVGDFTAEVASGLHVVEGPATMPKSWHLRTLTAGSGGEALHSGAIVSVCYKSLQGNAGDIYVCGCTSGYFPYSGFGFPLSPGEALTDNIDAFEKIILFPTCSGDIVGFRGLAK